MTLGVVGHPQRSVFAEGHGRPLDLGLWPRSPDSGLRTTGSAFLNCGSMLPNRGYLPRLAAGSQFRTHCGNYPRFGRYSPQSLCGIYGTNHESSHTREELDDILGWFTGLDSDGLEAAQDLSLRDFLSQITLHPNTDLITGTVCGVRVQEVEDALMQKIRRMDLLIDEIARGKTPTHIKC